MKNMKCITLGIVLVSASLALARDADVIRERTPLPPKPPAPPEVDVFSERHVSAALAEQPAPIEATATRVAEAAKAQAGAQKRMMLAQAGGGGGGTGGMGGRDFELAFGTSLRSPRPLVIPKDASDARSLGEVEEDLGVMTHLLDKTVSNGNKAARAMGIAVFTRFPGATAAPQNLYIDGYGAIFLLHVNYPLVPPPKKVEETGAKEPVNNEWEEARREMARPGKSQAGADPFEMIEERFGEDLMWNGKLPTVEYDEDKVEELKKSLITVLKNAANIRRMKSEEWVAVVVTGADAGLVNKAFKSSGSKSDNSKRERVVAVTTSSSERTRVINPARLIIRVRKADAEAFQSGQLDFDAFQKKVTVMIF